jgi:hypothetical protein
MVRGHHEDSLIPKIISLERSCHLPHEIVHIEDLGIIVVGDARKVIIIVLNIPKKIVCPSAPGTDRLYWA